MLRLTGRQVESLFDQLLPVEVRELLADRKQSIDDRDGRGLRRRPARMALGTGWLREGPLVLFAEAVRLHQPLLPVLSSQDPLAAGGAGVGGAAAAPGDGVALEPAGV